MILIFIILSATILLIFPNDVYAWGPATHLNLGLSIVENIKILTGEVSSLILNNTAQFLYGCLSADIIQAKRLVKYVENCHNWENGFKLLRSAKSQELKSFAHGYLSHLAADIVAHNCYVPAKMIESYSKRGLKHFPWEMRFDVEMYNEKTGEALRDLIKGDHSAEDDLMNSLLKTAIFSFKMNKRIFSSLLLVERVERWKKLISEPNLRNHYYLSPEEVEYYYNMSLNAIIGFLIDMKESKYIRYDPTGKKSLAKAQAVMKDLKKREKKGMDDQTAHEEMVKNVSYFRSEFLK